MTYDKCRILLLIMGIIFITAGVYFFKTSNFPGEKIVGISFIMLGCFSAGIYAYSEFIPKENSRPDISHYKHIETSYDAINYAEELPFYVEHENDT